MLRFPTKLQTKYYSNLFPLLSSISRTSKELSTIVLLYYIFDIYLYGLTIILAIVVSFVSLAIGFLSLVLSKLFDMAIEIKEENDKTI